MPGDQATEARGDEPTGLLRALSSRPELSSVSWLCSLRSDMRQARLKGVVPAWTHRMKLQIERLHDLFADALAEGKHLREQKGTHFKTRLGRSAPNTRKQRLESA